MNLKKIGLLGGDMRQIHLASLLAGDGYETAVWGFGRVMDQPEIREKLSKCVRCADWESALRASSAVILPLPVTQDGVRLHCPYTMQDGDIRLTEIIEKTPADCAVFGGKLPTLIRRLADERGIVLRDYYESEALQIHNSVPTAEGAIDIAIRELPVTVQGCRALVTGYGRVARTLAHKLTLLGARVLVVARSEKDLAWAECEGACAVKLEEYRAAPSVFLSDIIFNTVPALIFDEALLSKIEKSTLLVELASANSGIDGKYAAEHGFRYLSAQGLPGKLSPYSAGEIIFHAIRPLLS